MCIHPAGIQIFAVRSPHVLSMKNLKEPEQNKGSLFIHFYLFLKQLPLNYQCLEKMFAFKFTLLNSHQVVDEYPLIPVN